MARIAGVNVPLNKRVEVGLTYVHGIGRSTANGILKKVGVDPNTYVKDLTDDEVVKLREAVESEEVEGDLRRDRSQNIKRLSEIGTYRGSRHRRRRRPQGHGARARAGRGAREGRRIGPRHGDPLAAGRRPPGHDREGRHPAGPQRLPAAQEAEGVMVSDVRRETNFAPPAGEVF